MEYIFGYGSLINTFSRLRSLPASQSIAPVAVLHGFVRRWGFRCSRREFTALSVEKGSKKDWINGVLVAVNDWKNLDDREKNYARYRVDPQYLTSDIPDGSTVWVYAIPNKFETDHSTCKRGVNQYNSHYPSMNCPIPQSYLDCVMAGCIAISTQFAADFIKSTIGWPNRTRDKSWVNDRNSCRTHRKYVCLASVGEVECVNVYSKIDLLLSEIVPLELNERVFAKCVRSCSSQCLLI